MAREDRGHDHVRGLEHAPPEVLRHPEVVVQAEMRTVRLMDLISFFTVGEDEVRAWPIRRGTRARQAADKVHSDLERGFIRAEIMPYDVFIQHGAEAAVKDAGKLQIEGKDHEVKDGEIMHVRFNV